MSIECIFCSIINLWEFCCLGTLDSLHQVVSIPFYDRFFSVNINNRRVSWSLSLVLKQIKCIFLLSLARGVVTLKLCSVVLHLEGLRCLEEKKFYSDWSWVKCIHCTYIYRYATVYKHVHMLYRIHWFKFWYFDDFLTFPKCSSCALGSSKQELWNFSVSFVPFVKPGCFIKNWSGYISVFWFSHPHAETIFAQASEIICLLTHQMVGILKSKWGEMA